MAFVWGKMGDVDGSAAVSNIYNPSSSLVVLLHGPKDSSAADIKHLHHTLVAPGDDQLAIFSKFPRTSNEFEPRDGFDHLAGLGSVDQHSRGGADGVAMWLGWAKVDVRDWTGMLDEKRMTERLEVAGVG